MYMLVRCMHTSELMARDSATGTTVIGNDMPLLSSHYLDIRGAL